MPPPPAALLCGLHGVWFMQQRTYYEAKAQRLTKMDKSLTDLNKKIAEGNDQKALLETKLNKMSADGDLVPSVIRKLQQRPALLMRALAEGRDDGFDYRKL